MLSSGSVSEVVRKGETTFKGVGREGTFRFVIRDDEGKVNFWLEEKKTRMQWCSGYLARDQYVTEENKIAGLKKRDYAKIFFNILTDSVDSRGDEDRNVLDLLDGAVRLSLYANFTVLSVPCRLSYWFQLEPISLERIRTLQAKVVKENTAAEEKE